MVVVGAQFSPRPDAKQYSATLHGTCVKLMSERGPITSRSRLFELQIVIHLEMFTRYRARSAKTGHMRGSPQFQSLYTSLVADQDWLQGTLATLIETLPVTNPAQVQNIYRTWLDMETRSRLLAAAFVLDSQHNHLLQQELSDHGTMGGDDRTNIPFPSSAEAWNCTDLVPWRDLMTAQQPLTLGSVDSTLPPLDPFQASLRICYQLHSMRLTEISTETSLLYHPTKLGSLATVLTFHALSLSLLTPLHALIITASESWLFGTKITDKDVWQQAKLTLRNWVNGNAATKAVWHATQLLRLAFVNYGQQPLEMDGVGYLHDLWCLYIAALVCWAYGYGTGEDHADERAPWAPENAETFAGEYLAAMEVGEGWWEIGNVCKAARRRTRGLLEWVRVKVGDVGLGGLLDGAEDVLFRLVDGESEMVRF
ncbi:MAG: hypothetical protein Q9219_007665 [cf. Caloplaca sp. 3 TL-2023]